jgi:hypothetical protein
MGQHGGGFAWLLIYPNLKIGIHTAKNTMIPPADLYVMENCEFKKERVKGCCTTILVNP